jgi:hypothetical protein
MLIPTLLPSCCTGLHVAVIIDIRSNSSNLSVSCQLSLAHIHFGFDNAGLTVSGSLPSLSQPLTLFHSQLFSRLPMYLTHPRLQVYKAYSDQMLNIGVMLGVFSIHQKLLPVIQSHQVHSVALVPLKVQSWALLSSTVLLYLGHRSIQYSQSQYPGLC